MSVEALQVVFYLSTVIFWSLAYIGMIWKGAKDKTFGMPFIPLCANFAWEFYFGVLQFRIDYSLWFALDATIFAQLVIYGRKEFTSHPFIYKWFYWLIGITLFFSMYGLYAIQQCLGLDHARYMVGVALDIPIAIAMNFMLLARGSNLRGQHIIIAVCKLLGDLSAFLVRWVDSEWNQDSDTAFFTWMAVLSLVFGLLYVVLIASVQFGGVNLWERVNVECSGLMSAPIDKRPDEYDPRALVPATLSDSGSTSLENC